MLAVDMQNVEVQTVNNAADLRKAMNDLIRKQRNQKNNVKTATSSKEGEEEEDDDEDDEEDGQSFHTKVQKIVVDSQEDKEAAYYKAINNAK